MPTVGIRVRASHDPPVSVVDLRSEQHDEQRLRAFALRVHRARLQARLAAAFVVRGLPVLCVAFALATVWPKFGLVCVVAASVLVGIELLTVAVRERRALRRALLELGGGGQAMGDLLLAWQESAAGAGEPAMRAWLGDLLARKVDALPRDAERSWVAVGLGPARYLVPAAVALMLLWWMRPSTPMPWFGLGAQAQSGPSGAGGGGQSGQGDGEPDEPQDAPRDQGTSQKQEETPPPEEPQEPFGPEPAPAPFVDLPAEAAVVVPEFTRDGPTRRAMAQQALTGADEGPGAAPRASASGAGPLTAIDAPKPEDFERAKEKALQSRRIPERERAMVRSFFDALRGSDK